MKLAAICHHCRKSNSVDLEPPGMVRLTCPGCQRRIYVHARIGPHDAVTCYTSDSPVLPTRRAEDHS